MSHPLIDNFRDLSDADLHEKIVDLSTKYWQTHNPGVQAQMTQILDELKAESTNRSSKMTQNISAEDGENSLDNLINIS